MLAGGSEITNKWSGTCSANACSIYYGSKIQMSNSKSTIPSEPAFFDPADQSRLFKAVIQRSLSAILIFQADRVVFSNPAFQEIVGLDEDKILRMNPFDLVHPEDRGLVRERAMQRMKGLSPPDDYEFRILTADGSFKWVHLLATSITYRSQPSVLANMLNIDERKKAEKLKFEAERLRTTLLDTLPHPTMLVSRNRIILAANRLALDLGSRIGGFCWDGFGRRGQLHDSPSNFQEMTNSPSDAGSTKCDFCLADEAMETSEPRNIRALEAFGGLWDVFWIPVDANTYFHYAIDVTDRHKIEQAVRDSEERYRLITDTMNDGLSIQNREGVITQVNRRLCEITGLSRRELIGRHLADLLVKDNEISYDMAVSPKPGKEIESETFVLHKDGRKMAVILKIDFLVDENGHRKGSYAFFSDISELRMLRRYALTSDVFENIVGNEPCMRRLFTEIIEVATCDFPVLIQGESGVGKELVAQAIHNQSHRRSAMFVPVNCGALPEGLLETELFGHVKGAFTGAIRDKKGRFELANGGTIFLDEVAELSMSMQVKLLRILQEGTFERVGDHRSSKVDVRVVSATNKHLEHEMNAGRFRSDLYYRLCVMPIQVPPLRERKKDIPLLVDHFFATIASRNPMRKLSLSKEALELLMAYDWPGNVRELQNVTQLASVKSKGATIHPAHLPAGFGSPSASRVTRRRNRRRKLDPQAVQDALRRTGGNKLQAAKLLGVHRSTLYRFIDVVKTDS
jgi:sigma-54 dependent transcriptional regulator, acetoin dehydrogenase operon transcriptional activator AcoR